MSTGLSTLLEVQEHDLALDRLQHRHDTLPERAALAAAVVRGDVLDARRAVVRTQRDELARDEARLDDEARGLEAKAKDVETKMYSGEISSPRELQAMQADVDQLHRHRRDVENRELEVMEQREPLEGELAGLERDRATVDDDIAHVSGSLRAAEAEIAAEVAVERAARDQLTEGLDPALVAAYEQRRAHARGVGAARLVGGTCQGCHLSIPSTEAERIRNAPEGTLSYCDNCGCILVP